MIDFSETFRLSVTELRRNKTRSLLTMLGIIIGVFAVITLVSIGSGLQNFITKQFEDIGANVLYVMPGNISEDNAFSGGPPSFSSSKLKSSHIKEIERIGPPITEVTGDIEMSAIIKYKNKQKRGQVVGGTPQIMQFASYTIEKGRFFTTTEVNSERKVVVIGSEIASKLFEGKEPIGEEIVISDYRFKIIGVLKSKGGGLGGSQDSVVSIPITAAQTIFGMNSLQSIFVRFSDKDKADEAKYKIKTVLLRTLKADDFSVINQGSLLNTISSILGVLTTALGGIAAISLLVGGIGIMNIMLVSVTERTREIGIRKSVGATNSDILSQFMIEAVFLSIVGGCIGVILGVFGAMIIGRLISANALTWWSILLALGVSSLIGIVFGVAPAAKAAKLDPVEALRYE